MLPHHQGALDKAKERLLSLPGIIAILLGGSIAKGVERPDSDVDLIVVVTEEEYAARRARHDVAFLWRDVADYEGGYVEGRFVPRGFVLEAADRGSEPTRHSFTGVYPVHCLDAQVAAAIPKIAIYPVADQQRRIASFHAQMALNRWFFWHEGIRRNDPYLKHRAATDIVLFGGRMILAHNRKLFPCQKRLMETVEACEHKPADIVAKAGRLLTEMTEAVKEEFCIAVEECVKPPQSDLLSLFLEDVETAWYTRSIAVAEW